MRILLVDDDEKKIEQIGDFVALDDRACVRLLVGHFRHGVDILSAWLAPQIDTAVGDDPIEPGRELGPAVLPLAAMGPDLEHGVLHHVLGVRRVADDAHAPVECRDLAFEGMWRCGSSRRFWYRLTSVARLRSLLNERSIRSTPAAKASATEKFGFCTRLPLSALLAG